MKRILPVGIDEVEPVTFAIKVTLEPSADGFGDADNTIDVERFFHPLAPTACTKTPERTGGAPALPRYRTVMACDPAVREVVMKLADPDAMVEAPSRVAPS